MQSSSGGGTCWRYLGWIHGWAAHPPVPVPWKLQQDGTHRHSTAGWVTVCSLYLLGILWEQCSSCYWWQWDQFCCQHIHHSLTNQAHFSLKLQSLEHLSGMTTKTIQYKGFQEIKRQIIPEMWCLCHLKATNNFKNIALAPWNNQNTGVFL